MIDPLERWRRYGEKPDYAGLLTFGGAPYTQDPAELEGVDAGDLLVACRRLASRIDLVGAELVEVIPTGVGSADITSLAGDRIVREIVTGLALRRRG